MNMLWFPVWHLMVFGMGRNSSGAMVGKRKHQPKTLAQQCNILPFHCSKSKSVEMGNQQSTQVPPHLVLHLYGRDLGWNVLFPDVLLNMNIMLSKLLKSCVTDFIKSSPWSYRKLTMGGVVQWGKWFPGVGKSLDFPSRWTWHLCRRQPSPAASTNLATRSGCQKRI